MGDDCLQLLRIERPQSGKRDQKNGLRVQPGPGLWQYDYFQLVCGAVGYVALGCDFSDGTRWRFSDAT
jgi:hypothetical protein